MITEQKITFTEDLLVEFTAQAEEKYRKIGEEIINYAHKYTGTPLYNEVLHAIKFGCDLTLKYE